jgi:phosphodiesterase/alkaline phosphatase D-like protein
MRRKRGPASAEPSRPSLSVHGMSLSRRSFLYYSGPLAVLPILPRECGRLTDDYENAGPPFLHGVASGDPLEDRVVLWTRVTGDSGAPARVVVSWSVAKDAKFERLVASGVTATDADFDFTVKVDAAGLKGRHRQRDRAHGRHSFLVGQRADRNPLQSHHLRPGHGCR